MDSRFILPAIIFLFFIGIGGIILNRRNLLLMLISVELILLAVNIQLSLFALILDDLIGVIIALLVLTVAPAESAIGLALLVVHYRIRGSISTDLLRLLKNLVFKTTVLLRKWLSGLKRRIVIPLGFPITSSNLVFLIYNVL